MTKWLWIGMGTVVVGMVGGYSFHMVTDSPAQLVARARIAPVKHDGEAETSDAIEPLVVEGSGFGTTVLRMPIGDETPMSRVVMTTGMRQPPRPDAETGTVARMPYADEESPWLSVTVDPVLRLLESNLPPLELDPTEDSENRDATPEPPMARDYHQQHCPAHGYPYNRR